MLKAALDAGKRVREGSPLHLYVSLWGFHIFFKICSLGPVTSRVYPAHLVPLVTARPRGWYYYYLSSSWAVVRKLKVEQPERSRRRALNCPAFFAV